MFGDIVTNFIGKGARPKYQSTPYSGISMRKRTQDSLGYSMLMPNTDEKNKITRDQKEIWSKVNVKENKIYAKQICSKKYKSKHTKCLKHR